VTTRVYATSTDLAAYTGSSAPADADALLAKASVFLDSSVFRLCWFTADTNGLPTDTVVAAAFTRAVCAQAAWWGALGDSVGAMGAGWGEIRIGTVQMSRSLTRTGAEDSAARQVAPEVWDVLRSSDLTPDRLWIGAVVS
jgi:hypothetical protein